jgi:ankyrin repeat protein
MKSKPFYVFDSGLFSAVAEGNAEAAGLLLDKGVPVNVPSLPGFPPLLVAALFGRRELARMLLKRGADPSLRFEGLVTPLLCAVRAGDVEMVRVLLEAGADTEAKSRKGLSALGLAEACGFEAIAELLRKSSP